MVVIVGITSLVDPNDYAPDIEAVAGNNQLTLDIKGDISWQFFPQLGISVKRIVFSNNVISAGSIDELVITAGLLNLLNTDFDQKIPVPFTPLAAPVAPTMPTAPTVAVAPPLPPEGLPPGWTMDQWAWYGADYLKNR